ncbi:hypothetical protein JKY79_02350 [Candidatus Babeliales bacterium]|nr:hypothetical protein [Candidatus Babeliales bacterium]
MNLIHDQELKDEDGNLFTSWKALDSILFVEAIRNNDEVRVKEILGRCSQEVKNEFLGLTITKNGYEEALLDYLVGSSNGAEFPLCKYLINEIEKEDEQLTVAVDRAMVAGYDCSELLECLHKKDPSLFDREFEFLFVHKTLNMQKVISLGGGTSQKCYHDLRRISETDHLLQTEELKQLVQMIEEKHPEYLEDISGYEDDKDQLVSAIKSNDEVRVKDILGKYDDDDQRKKELLNKLIDHQYLDGSCMQSATVVPFIYAVKEHCLNNINTLPLCKHLIDEMSLCLTSEKDLKSKEKTFKYAISCCFLSDIDCSNLLKALHKKDANLFADGKCFSSNFENIEKAIECGSEVSQDSCNYVRYQLEQKQNGQEDVLDLQALETKIKEKYPKYFENNSGYETYKNKEIKNKLKVTQTTFSGASLVKKAEPCFWMAAAACRLHRLHQDIDNFEAIDDEVDQEKAIVEEQSAKKNDQKKKVSTAEYFKIIFSSPKKYYKNIARVASVPFLIGCAAKSWDKGLLFNR